MKIKERVRIQDEEDEDIKPISESQDNKLEFLKQMTEVKSKIREEISEDFTLAKLSEKDQEAIVEMVTDAYYGLKLIKTAAMNATKWHYNTKNQTWTQTWVSREEREIMNQHATNTFNAFMTRLYMTSIVKRNQKDNYLIRIIAGLAQEEPEEETGEELEKQGAISKLTNKVKDVLKKREE